MPTTTPKYVLPSPLGSEPPDGPAQIKALAQRVEAVLAAAIDRSGWARGAWTLGSITPGTGTWVKPGLTAGTPAPVDVSTPSAKITVAQSGIFLICVRGAWDYQVAGTTGSRLMQVRKNGTDGTTGGTLLVFDTLDMTKGSSQTHNLVVAEFLSAGDFVEVVVQQNAGQSITFTGGRLDVFRIA